MLRYAWKKQGTFLLIYAVVLVLASVAVAIGGPKALQFAADWWGRVGAILGLAALGVAVLVWLGELRQDWEASLPKRLDVFCYVEPPDHNAKPELIMACYGATLSGESDIRAMAQQVGFQQLKEHLKLSPRFDILPPVVDPKAMLKRYVVHIYVTEPPAIITSGRNKNPKFGILCREEKGVWKSTHQTDLSSKCDEIDKQ